MLCVRDTTGLWRPLTDVTEDCRAAHRAGLARFDGLLWHLTDAGALHLANNTDESLYTCDNGACFT